MYSMYTIYMYMCTVNEAALKINKAVGVMREDPKTNPRVGVQGGHWGH